MSDDVWGWIYDYQDQLYDRDQEDWVYKIDDFIHEAYEKNVEEVEARYPELISFARAEENKWLEVLIRHWRLQSYISTNHDPRPRLQEALELLEFSHQPDVYDVPQRTCVADDLQAFFKVLDGPGYADECVKMLNAELERISPNKDCFMCMVTAKVDALCEAERFEDALDAWETAKQQAGQTFAGEEGAPHFNRYVADCIAYVHAHLGNFDRANEFLEMSQPEGSFRMNEKKLVQGILQAKMRKSEDAAAVLAGFKSQALDDIPAKYFVELSRLIGWPTDENTPDYFVKQLEDVALRSKNHGRMRDAFNAADLAFHGHARLGDEDGSNRCIEILETVLPDLAQPLNARKRLDEARAAIS